MHGTNVKININLALGNKKKLKKHGRTTKYFDLFTISDSLLRNDTIPLSAEG